jgi:hypothetical protein
VGRQVVTRQTLGLLLLLLLFASCDNASFRDCAIACTAQTGCPDGLSCGTEGFCRNGATATSCNTVRDAQDADTSCVCANTDTLSCSSGQTSCALGCVAEGVAHCRTVMPSNGVPLGSLDQLATAITLDGTATFNTDTGAITGAITRTAGAGVHDDIAFTTSGMIGVFTMHQLTVSPFGTIQFTGARAAAIVVETVATIEGEIDASGGCYGATRSCAGPGGGAGGTTTPALGCGPGGEGESAGSNSDPGGGGGGSRRAGAAGGADTLSTAGLGGIACMSPMAEPLIGGSGGGIGGLGSATVPSPGGGGGGAFQLTALEKITVNGAIDAGGAGGAGGTGAGGDRGGGGGAGGGAGGSILLEAPLVVIDGVVVANGGAGGSPGNGTTIGTDGANATRSTTPALGGTSTFGNGGNGGAGTTAATVGTNGGTGVNGGGGGGGVGAIFIRTLDPPVFTGAVFSPPVGTAELRTQ